MNIPLFTLPGGIHPPEYKTASVQEPIGQLPLPDHLYIALAQHMGAPAKAVVKVDQHVLKGQLIAEADGVFSVNIHAPTSGYIRSIEDYPQAHPSGLSAPCILLESDDQDEWVERQPIADYTSLQPADLLERIRKAGIAGLGGAGFPTAIKLNPRSTAPIDTLIINGAECEPYITADDVLMRERADEVIAGTLMLGYLLHNPARLVIGVEDNKPEAIAALQKAAAGTAVEVVGFPTKYPSGGAKQLTWILTGREVPHGHHSADAGVICLNVATVAAAWRAVRFDEPLISRITTLAGDALASSRNVEVLIGTPIGTLLQHQGLQPKQLSRLVVGGPMMGFTLTDTRAPVTKTTNCLIAAGKKELPLPPPAQACIRCGYCADVCPASLLPQQLFWYAQAEDHDRLKSHHLFDCIECGACSWVCPSSIPLVQYYRAAKGSIIQAETEKEKAERSRRRFEFRQQRMEQEETAKEAKRLARKQAADEARLKLAQKAEQAVTTNEPASPVVARAPVKAAVDNGVDQRARLERILAAAHNTLEHAQKPLVPHVYGEEISAEKLEKQQARIKQAALKVSEAEKKLADFVASQEGAAAQPVASPADDAIERARAKMARNPREKLEAGLETLQKQLLKAQERAATARANGEATADAFERGVAVLQQKIATTKEDLAALPVDSANATASSEEQAATESAIEKARQRLAAKAEKSPADIRAEQIQTLTVRIEKTRGLLKDAEAKGAPTVAALTNSLQKQEEKLNALQSEN